MTTNTDQPGQLPLVIPQALTLERMLAHISYHTIIDMIHDLDRAIDNHWSFPENAPGPEIVAARNAMRQYMDRAWPGKMEEEPMT